MNRALYFLMLIKGLAFVIIAKILHPRLSISPWQLFQEKIDITIKKNGHIHIGKKLYARKNVSLLADSGTLNIHSNVFMNHNVAISALESIEIESYVTIANNVVIVDHDHDLYSTGFVKSPVQIKEYAWIGANAVILKGVTIGKHSVVAAGAIVTRSVPDYTIVAGNPAKIIKTILHK